MRLSRAGGPGGREAEPGGRSGRSLTRAGGRGGLAFIEPGGRDAPHYPMMGHLRRSCCTRREAGQALN